MTLNWIVFLIFAGICTLITVDALWLEPRRHIRRERLIAQWWQDHPGATHEEYITYLDSLYPRWRRPR